MKGTILALAVAAAVMLVGCSGGNKGGSSIMLTPAEEERAVAIARQSDYLDVDFPGVIIDCRGNECYLPAYGRWFNVVEIARLGESIDARTWRLDAEIGQRTVVASGCVSAGGQSACLSYVFGNSAPFSFRGTATGVSIESRNGHRGTASLYYDGNVDLTLSELSDGRTVTYPNLPLSQNRFSGVSSTRTGAVNGFAAGSEAAGTFDIGELSGVWQVKRP